MLSNLTVPVLNRYDLLQRMVDSIDQPIGHLLIIDNGGELGWLSVPAMVRRLTILNMPTNLGVASSWNLGIKSFYQAPVCFFASADVVFAPGDLEQLAHSSPDEITLHAQHPHWQAFAIGENVVEKIGLFDESLHPIYFEDNDYMRRADFAGIAMTHLPLVGGHLNSATIHSDNYYKQRNDETFRDNHAYYSDKVARNDLSEGRWDISRTRRNSWATEKK